MTSPFHQLESILLHILNTNNTIRKDAESKLAGYSTKHNEYIILLTEMVNNSGDINAKLLAGILLRQQIDATNLCWDNCTIEVKINVRNNILNLLNNLPVIEKVLRRNIIEAVGSLAVKALPNNEWPDFLPSLLNLGKSDQYIHRIAVLNILEKIILMTPDSLKNDLESIKSVLYSALNDANNEVSLAAVVSLVSFLSFITPQQRKQLVDSVPMIFKVLNVNLTTGDDLKINECLESLNKLVICDATFFKPYLPDILALVSGAVVNGDLESGTKKMCMEFLLSLAENGQGMIRKMSSFAQTVVPLAFKFLLFPDIDSDWFNVPTEMELDHDEFNMGLESVDRLAEALGGKIFVPLALPLIREGLSSQDWTHRHASLSMLAEMAHGCMKIMKPKADEILDNFLKPHINDPHPRVRFAVMNCLAQFCNDFAPSFQNTYHDSIMPIIVSGIKDPIARVSCHSALLLVDFCAGIEGEDDTEYFIAYTEGLLSELMNIIQLATNTYSGNVPCLAPNKPQAWLHVIEGVLTAISTVAHISKQEFCKYYPFFMPIFKSILNSQSVETRMAKGKAMECVGLVGVAIGKEKFEKDAVEVMNLIMQFNGQMSSDDPSYSYMVQAIARICEAIGSSFTPFLPYVIPPLIESLKVEAGRIIPDVGPESELKENEERVIVSLSGVGNVRLEYNTELLREKSLAANILYSYAKTLRSGFFPYAKAVLDEALTLMKYRFNEGVRVAAVLTIPALLLCVYEHCIESIRQANLIVDYAEIDRSTMIPIFKLVCEPFLVCMRLESDLDQLCNIVRSFTECLELLHTPIDAEMMTLVAIEVNKCIIASFERRIERKEKVQEEDADERTAEDFQEIEDQEAELLGFLIDFSNRMVKNGREQFVQIFNQELAQSVISFLVDEKFNDNEKVCAICIFDDIIENGGELAKAHMPFFFPQLLKHFGSANPDLRQAAIYGIGVIAQYSSNELFLPYRENILTTLVSIIEAPGSRAEDCYPATCNAVSVFWKICTYKNTNLDINQILPKWMGWLPLNGDQDEAKTVHYRFFEFVETNNPIIIGENFCNLPRIANILSTIVFSEEVSDSELNTKISRFWKAICQQFPRESIEQIIAPLSDIQKSKLNDCLNYALL